jgi:ferric-chelate reductase [NAD(P)H]
MINNNIQLDSLYKIQYGMYIIATKFCDRINGQIATTLFQVTCEPIQVAICLSKNTLTHELIQQSNFFSACVLEQDTPMKFIGNFGFRSGRNFDKFFNINYFSKITECPLIRDHTLVAMEAEVKNQLDLKTHTLFIGELKSSELLKEGIALTYEYYHKVIKGKSPENAPTFQKTIGETV